MKDGFTIVFDVPDKPWSTNQDRNLHHQTRAKKIKCWKTATVVAYKNQLKGRELPPDAMVKVTIPFTTNQKRDPHNYCGTVVKAVIDGLVKGGAWPDDTPNYVDHISPICLKDKNGKVIVDILWERPIDDEEWDPLP